MLCVGLQDVTGGRSHPLTKRWELCPWKRREGRASEVHLSPLTTHCTRALPQPAESTDQDLHACGELGGAAAFSPQPTVHLGQGTSLRRLQVHSAHSEVRADEVWEVLGELGAQ